MGKFVTKFLLIIAWILVVFLGDLVVGKLYNYFAPEWGKRHLQLTINSYTSEKEINKSKTNIKPYLLYCNSPNFNVNGVKQHNNYGYRNSFDINMSKNENEFRILCIGGSTTYGAGVVLPQDAWPEQLIELISENNLKHLNNKKIRVINGGLEWATSAELLTHFSFKHIHLKPDLVIIHSGGNDLAPLWQNNFALDYSHWRELSSSASSTLRPYELNLIRFSNTIKFFYAIWFNSFGYSQAITTNSTKAYKTNLSNLVTLIQNNGAEAIFFQFYQPSYIELKNKNPAAFLKAEQNLGENCISYDESLQKGLARLRDETLQVCREKKIEFWEIDENKLPLEYFTDQCHLNKNGQQFKANFIFKNLQDKRL
jgi:lysophospholipase L1-like esterase